MAHTMELCTACREVMKDAYTLARVGGGVDNKITCSVCGKRRYGYTYDVTKKDAPTGKERRRNV